MNKIKAPTSIYMALKIIMATRSQFPKITGSGLMELRVVQMSLNDRVLHNGFEGMTQDYGSITK